MADEAVVAPAAAPADSPEPVPAAESPAEGLAEAQAEAASAEAASTEAAEVEARPRRLKLTPELRDVFRRFPELRDAYYRAQRFAELFPDFRTAERAARALAGFGSADELAAALEGAQKLAAIDRMWYSRDPQQHRAILENLAGDDPEAFATMVEVFPEAAAQLAPEAFARMTAALWTRALGQLLAEARQRGDQELAAAADRVAAALGLLRPWTLDGAQAALAQAERERQRQAERRRAAQQAQLAAAVAAANEQTVRSVLAAIEQHLEELFGAELPEASRRLLGGELYRRLDERLQVDRELAEQVRWLLAGANGDGRAERQAAQQVLARARQLLPELAREVLPAVNALVEAQARARARRPAPRADLGASSTLDARQGHTLPRPEELKRRGLYRRLSDDELLAGQF